MELLYCPRCGNVMEQRAIEGRYRDVCSRCEFIFYRNPVPAVGVVVPLDSGIVLVQRRFEPRAGYWGLPAGYMELGESAEETAVRECYEETGLEVRPDGLVGVYSYGTSTVSGLLIIYAATISGGTLCAGDDAMDVRVFDLDKLPQPLAFHTNLQAIERWRRERSAAHARHAMLAHSLQDIYVRPACRRDESEILRLLPFLPRARHNDESQFVNALALFHDRLNDPDRPILMATVEGDVVGFATAAFHRTLTGWQASIDDLVVHPAYRRRGVGQALVEATVRLARARSCASLHLNTTLESSEGRAFYRACGFDDGGVATLRIA